MRSMGLGPRQSVCLLGLIAGSAVANLAAAQRAVTAIGTPAEEHFEHFAGAGLSPQPAPGQLDSREWRVVYNDFTQCDFDATCDDTVLARGAVSGDVTPSGLYAFSPRGPGNPALGVQPAFNGFNPGSVTWRLRNDIGTTVSTATLAFRCFVYNDTHRSQYVVLEHSTDDETYVPIWDTTTPLEADPEPAWIESLVTVQLEALDWQPGTLLYLRWTTGDAEGSGDRPELAFDDLSLTAECQGPSDCVDGNPCTGHLCIEGACHSFFYPPGTLCDADNLCSELGTCNGSGTCQDGPLVDCDDDDPCTNDACLPSEGCVHEPVVGCVTVGDAGFPAGPGAHADAGTGPEGSIVAGDESDAGGWHDSADAAIDSSAGDSRDRDREHAGGSPSMGAEDALDGRGGMLHAADAGVPETVLVEQGCQCRVGRLQRSSAAGHLLSALLFALLLWPRRWRARPRRRNRQKQD